MRHSAASGRCNEEAPRLSLRVGRPLRPRGQAGVAGGAKIESSIGRPGSVGLPTPLRVIALVSTYNEDDIIACSLGDLARQGISVYLLDHGSTDRTLEEAARLPGRGLLGAERIETGPAAGDEPGARASWASVLHRKEELAAKLDGDWFLHHDADEFRESPWPRLSLVEAIGLVDRLGYNAVDFELYDFQPTHDGFRRGDDPRESFPCFAPARPCDRAQVRCWKQAPGVDLVSSGGHEARFAGRKVFPIRFLLRHYPIRGQAHGERKVRERMARFGAEARVRGWHLHYAEFAPGHAFLRDPASLERFDPELARLRLFLRHRIVEELEGTPEATVRLSADRDWERERLSRELDARNREAARLHADLDVRNREVVRLDAQLGAAEAELRAIRASRTWRWSEPLRRLSARLGIR